MGLQREIQYTFTAKLCRTRILSSIFPMKLGHAASSSVQLGKMKVASDVT
jgi:hypothetical protein